MQYCFGSALDCRSNKPHNPSVAFPAAALSLGLSDMEKTSAHTALFGPYAVELRSGELRKFGTRVKMGEQPFQVLLMLLERPGE